MLLSKRSPPCRKHSGGLRLSRRTWCSSKCSKELDHAWLLPWRQRHSWNPAGEGQRAITQCFTSLGEHEGFLSCRHQRDWRLPAGGWRKCCNTCLTVLRPVKPHALSSGWVCFSPPEPCWIYPELPADEAWLHGAPQPWSACQLRQVPKRDSTLKTVCCHRPASCPRMSPVEVHKAGNSSPSCACAGWSVTKHVCLCMYIHMDACLCCQAECKAATFSLSGDTHLKASAQLLVSKKRKNVGPSLRLLVLSNLAETS